MLPLPNKSHQIRRRHFVPVMTDKARPIRDITLDRNTLPAANDSTDSLSTAGPDDVDSATSESTLTLDSFPHADVPTTTNQANATKRCRLM